jgi:hypothetical protein
MCLVSLANGVRVEEEEAADDDDDHHHHKELG